MEKIICTSNFNVKELVLGNYLFLSTLGKKEVFT